MATRKSVASRSTSPRKAGTAAAASFTVGDFTISTGGELPSATMAPNAAAHTFPWDALADRAEDRPHFDVPDSYWTKRDPKAGVPKKSQKWDRIRRSFEGWQAQGGLPSQVAAFRKGLTVLRRYNDASVTVWVVLSSDAAGTAEDEGASAAE